MTKVGYVDAICPEFLSYMSNVRAQHMVLSGFHGMYMAEAVDKAKYCASYAEYVQCICFDLEGIDQFEAVLENGRDLPKTAQNLCISMTTGTYGVRSPCPESRLNPKRRRMAEVLVLRRNKWRSLLSASNSTTLCRQRLRSGTNN